MQRIWWAGFALQVLQKSSLIAQLVERETVNLEVVASIPTWSEFSFKGLHMSHLEIPLTQYCVCWYLWEYQLVQKVPTEQCYQNLSWIFYSVSQDMVAARTMSMKLVNNSHAQRLSQVLGPKIHNWLISVHAELSHAPVKHAWGKARVTLGYSWCYNTSSAWKQALKLATWLQRI